MGMTALLVKRHIYRLSADDIFSTRDLLAYGLRKNIDNLIYRLVKRGEIRRLANGIFCRNIGRQREFSAMQIVKAKLTAYGKHFWHDTRMKKMSAKDTSESIHANADLTVRVVGSTSSFKIYTGNRVCLKGTAARKMKLGNTPAAEFARRLWDGNKKDLRPMAIDDLIMECELQRPERIEFLLAFNLLPAWLNDPLYHIRRRYFGPTLGRLYEFSTAVKRVSAKSWFKNQVVSRGEQQEIIDRKHSRINGCVPVIPRF